MKKEGFKEYDREFIDGIIYGVFLSIMGGFVVASYMKITVFTQEQLFVVMITSILTMMVLVLIITWKKKNK
jgi:uncharacterized membrane protein YesL